MSNSPASKIYLRPHHEPGRKQATRTYIIYFITGNPGLIEYYRTFLTHLYGLLTRDTASNRDVEFQVYGRSLSGFEMKSHEINTMKWHKIPPYGLQDQIRHAEDELTDLVEDVSDDGHRDVRVIVMGHSVGSYIALEIIRRLRAHGIAGEDYATRIIGGVALFPTVMEIVRSESGQKAAVSITHPFGHVLPLTLHTAIPEAFQLRFLRLRSCQPSHPPNSNLSPGNTHQVDHGLPRRRSTHHSLLHQISPRSPASPPHGS